MKIIQGKRPRIQPYSFYIKNHTEEELITIFSWIFTEIGPYNKEVMEFRLNAEWITGGNSTVYFANEDDATAFKLRWV